MKYHFFRLRFCWQNENNLTGFFPDNLKCFLNCNFDTFILKKKKQTIFLHLHISAKKFLLIPGRVPLQALRNFTKLNFNTVHFVAILILISTNSDKLQSKNCSWNFLLHYTHTYCAVRNRCYAYAFFLTNSRSSNISNDLWRS